MIAIASVQRWPLEMFMRLGSLGLDVFRRVRITRTVFRGVVPDFAIGE